MNNAELVSKYYRVVKDATVAITRPEPHPLPRGAFLPIEEAHMTALYALLTRLERYEAIRQAAIKFVGKLDDESELVNTLEDFEKHSGD